MPAWPPGIPRLGTIGFAYPDWTGPFYPRGAGGADRLAVYSEHFDAVEIDATFHALPMPKTVRNWHDAVPQDFRFCLKTPRLITHGTEPGHLLLPGVRGMMGEFLRLSGHLRDKLAAVLIQFPRAFTAERHHELGAFLSRLPDRCRYAVELRHNSWWVPETAELLRSLGVCWVAGDEVRMHEADMPPGQYRPRPIVPTAGCLYVRWVGWHEQFPDLAQEYLDPTARLRWWAERLSRVLAQRPEVTGAFGFFGNGYSGHAPATCRRFAEVAGVGLREPREDPGLLFEEA